MAAAKPCHIAGSAPAYVYTSPVYAEACDLLFGVLILKFLHGTQPDGLTVKSRDCEASESN
jgi:hypothetical protein